MNKLCTDVTLVWSWNVLAWMCARVALSRYNLKNLQPRTEVQRKADSMWSLRNTRRIHVDAILITWKPSGSRITFVSCKLYKRISCSGTNVTPEDDSIMDSEQMQISCHSFAIIVPMCWSLMACVDRRNWLMGLIPVNCGLSAILLLSCLPTCMVSGQVLEFEAL